MYKLDDSKYNPLANPDNIISSDKYRFTFMSESLFRFEYNEEGKFEDQTTPMAINRNFPDLDFEQEIKDGVLYIKTSKLEIKYDQEVPSPYGFQVRVLDSAIVYKFGDEYSRKYIEDNLGGTARTLDEVDGETDMGMGLLSRSGYAIYNDSNSAIINGEGLFIAREHEEIDLYFFGHSRNYQDAINDFHKLSGKTPLLPRYALGNWWSRYHKYSEESYLALMDKFEEHNIPISVAVIDMDWHLTDVDPKYGSGWTGYTWNKELFPDPQRFLNELHERGMKTSLNVHPADGIRAFEELYPAVAERVGIDPASEEQVEFEITNPDFVAAYFEELHHKLEEDGLDFWWIDWQQGTASRVKSVDPLWPLNHYHYLDNLKSEERGLIFSRYAGLGSHRYPVGFSGDTVISWESLEFQPRFTNSASNVAYTWWSHDIGGHMSGYMDPELEARWYQYGVYSPIFRLHSTSNLFMTKEPWLYDSNTEKIMTRAMQERYKLVPYIYTMNHLSHRDNLAINRPLYYEHPNDDRAYAYKNHFFFGTELLVVPMTSPVDEVTQLTREDAWLPEGDYFDIYNGRHYKGNKKISLHRDREAIAVFGRAGAILPLDNGDEFHNDLRNPDSLLFKAFTGQDGEFTLIEDDGIVVEPTEDDLLKTTISYKYNDGDNSVLEIFAEGNWSVSPAIRTYTVELYGVDNTEVEVEGAAILSSEHDADKNILRIELDSVEVDNPVRITFVNTKIAKNETERAIFNLLWKMQTKVDPKAYLHYLIYEYGFNAATISSLYASEEFDRKIVDVLAEIYFADK